MNNVIMLLEFFPAPSVDRDRNKTVGWICCAFLVVARALHAVGWKHIIPNLSWLKFHSTSSSSSLRCWCLFKNLYKKQQCAAVTACLFVKHEVNLSDQSTTHRLYRGETLYRVETSQVAIQRTTVSIWWESSHLMGPSKLLNELLLSLLRRAVD